MGKSLMTYSSASAADKGISAVACVCIGPLCAIVF